MKKFQFLVEKPIAHRGIHDKNCPENSLCAFDRAIVRGLPIELDLQLTRDEKLVVFHDWTIERMTNGKGKLSKKKCEELCRLSLQRTEERVPTFEDVLKLVNGRVPIVVEIKKKGFLVDDICNDVICELRNYNGQIAISSFNPLIIRWFKKDEPDIVRGQNFTNFGNDNVVVSFCKKLFLYTSWIMSDNEPDFFAIRAQLLPDVFPARIAMKNKKPILTYAVRNKEEYDRIKNVVDNEFIDNVE